MKLALLVSIFLRSFSVISAFGIFLITSYKYGPEGRGVISFVTSFYVMASLLLTFGLGRVFYEDLSKDISRLRLLLDTASRQIWLMSTGCLLVILLLMFLVPTGAVSIGREFDLRYFLFCLGTLPFYMWQNYSVYFYSSARKIEMQDKVIFWGRSFLMVAMFFVATLGASLEEFLMAFSVGSVAVVILEIQVLRRLFSGQVATNFKESYSLFHLLIPRCGWPFLDSVAQSLLLPATTFLLGFFISKEELGIFNFSMQMLVALLFPFTVLQSKLQQSLVGRANVKGDLIRYTKDIIPLTGAVIVLGLLIPYALEVVGLARFQQSAVFLRGQLLSIPVIAMAYLFQSFWIGLHKPKISSLVNVAMGITNALFVVALAPRLGGWAGVISLFVFHLLGVAIQFYYIRARWSSF